jgi:hypothetical protein
LKDLSPEHLAKLNPEVLDAKRWGVQHPNASHQQISEEIDKSMNQADSSEYLESREGFSTMRRLSKHPNLSSEHINKYIQKAVDAPDNGRHSSFYSNAITAVEHPNASEDNLRLAVQSFSNAYSQTAFAKHPKLPQDLVESFIKHEDDNVRGAIALNPSLNPEQFDRLLKDKYPWVATNAAGNPNIPEDLLRKILSTPSQDAYSSINKAAVTNNSLPKDLMMKYIQQGLGPDNTNWDNWGHRIVHNANLPPEALSMILKTHHSVSPRVENMRETALAHHRITAGNLTEAIPNMQYHEVNRIFNHAKVTSNHISAMVNHPDRDVRERLANVLTHSENPKVTPEHFSTLLNDKTLGPHSQRALAESNRLTPEHISHILKTNPRLASTAASNRNASAENIAEAMQSQDPVVRAAAAGNSNMAPAQLAQALQDVDEGVRFNAIDTGRPDITPQQLTQVLNTETNKETIRSVLNHPNRQQSHFLQVLQSQVPDAAEMVVRNYTNELSPAGVEMALTHPDQQVRNSVLRNKNKLTYSQIVRVLSSDPSADNIRIALRKFSPKGSAGIAILNKLAEHPNASVRTAVASSMHTPTETLKKLAQDSDAMVVDSAKYALRWKGGG